jgi:sodium/glucose cotransporter 9
MFWKRTTEQGAWWGLMAGLVVGVSRMAIHFSYPSPKCGGTDPDTRPPVFADVHYLHFAIISFVITLIVVIAVSLITTPRKQNQLRRVTWMTRNDPDEPELTDDEEEEEEEKEITQESSTGRKVYNLLCGFSDKKAPKLSEEEKAQNRKDMTSLVENPTASKLCDINAVIAIGVTCFIIGFYA